MSIKVRPHRYLRKSQILRDKNFRIIYFWTSTLALELKRQKLDVPFYSGRGQGNTFTMCNFHFDQPFQHYLPTQNFRWPKSYSKAQNFGNDLYFIRERGDFDHELAYKCCKPIGIWILYWHVLEVSKKLSKFNVGQWPGIMQALKVFAVWESNLGHTKSSDSLYKIVKNVASNPKCLTFFDSQLYRVITLKSRN